MSLCSPERVEFCTREREAAPPPTPSVPLTAHHVLILRLVLKIFAQASPTPSVVLPFQHWSTRHWTTSCHRWTATFAFPLCIGLVKFPFFRRQLVLVAPPSPWDPSLLPPHPRLFLSNVWNLTPPRDFPHFSLTGWVWQTLYQPLRGIRDTGHARGIRVSISGTLLTALLHVLNEASITSPTHRFHN